MAATSDETTNVKIDESVPIPEKGMTKALADHLTKIAVNQLGVSNKFKKDWLEKKRAQQDLRAGKVKKKLRMQFNVALPVYSGMLDTLAASFDEPVELEFQKKHPSDYFRAKKIQAAWNQESKSFDKDARWDYKSRVDKVLCINYGRGILKYYAESDPKYHSVLENVDPMLFHCQPKGGGILENHLFAGQEGIMRTVGDLESGVASGWYDSDQWDTLDERSKNTEYEAQMTESHKEKMIRFQSLGLDPDSNDYVGERTFNLCDWVLTYKGIRFYLVFDPWTQTWVHCTRLKESYSKNLMPWCSWATHEDIDVFWSKSYADEIYPVADAIVTLFNQELTNREKQNMNARAYDKDMFPDVAKLDAAQYRPDALVPVDTKGGTRQIQSGLYSFTTPELTGTIDLLDWVNTNLQKDTGVTDIAQGAAMDATKKVNVAYMEQAAVAKRIGYKSQSYTECWGEIGIRYVQGLKDHMSKDMYIEILGDSGIEPDVLTRDDVTELKDIGVNVISSTARKSEAQNKKAARVDALKLLMNSPNINSEMRDAAILRDIGGYEEAEISLFLDTKNYAAKASVAKAHIAIQELLVGEMPETNYKADSVFLKIIFDYMTEHRNKLGKERIKQFAIYISTNTQIAMNNAKQSAKMNQAKQAQQQQGVKGAARPVAKGTVAPAPEAQPAQQ